MLKENNNISKEDVLKSAKEKIEKYFMTGSLYCSETVIRVINEELDSPFTNEITRLATGFASGIGGAGCICGAVAGGVMALGIVYGRDYTEKPKEEIKKYSEELHKTIKEKFGSTCCRVLIKKYDFASRERKCHCESITYETIKYVIETLHKENKL